MEKCIYEIEVRTPSTITATMIKESINKDERIQELIRTRSFYGEFEIPNIVSINADPNRFFYIDPRCISHRILDFKIIKDKLIATIENLNKNDDYTNLIHENALELLLRGCYCQSTNRIKIITFDFGIKKPNIFKEDLKND